MRHHIRVREPNVLKARGWGKRSSVVVLAAVSALAGLGSTANAATLYWDGGTANLAGTNGDNASAGGAGNWSTSISNWDAGAGLDHVVWSAGNDATFGGTAGVVTLTTAISANSITLSPLTGGYTLTPSAANTLTIGTGGITASNTSGTNTISGAGVLLGGAQTWTTSGGTLAVTATTINNGGFLLTHAGTGFRTFGANAVLSGAGGLTVGAGTTTIQSISTYTGPTTVTGGTLNLQRTTQTAIAGTSAVTVSSGAAVQITDHAGASQAAYANAFNLTGTGVNGGGALRFFNSGGFSVSGDIGISGGTTIATDPAGQAMSSEVIITKAITGSGGLTLMAQGSSAGGTPRIRLDGASTYTGETRLTSSGSNTTPFRVWLQASPNRLPSNTSLIFGGTPAGSPTGIFDKSVTLGINNTSQTVAGLSTANTPAAGHAYRIVSLHPMNTAVFTINNATDNTFNGLFGGGTDVTITNPNNIRIVKSGAGALTLGGANTYTGTTTVDAGTLRAASTSAFGNGSAVTLANVVGATLDLNSNNVPIGSLAGGGALGGNVLLGSGTLTAGGNNGTTTYSGVISGTGGLTKAGTGTLTLSGANIYSDDTSLNAGSLTASNDSAFGTGDLQVNTGAIRVSLGDSVNLGNALTVSGGTGATGRGLIEYAGGTSATYSGLISVTQLPGAGGLFASTSTGTLNLTGAINSTVGVTVRLGTVVFANAGSTFSTLQMQAGTAKLGLTNGLPTNVAITLGSSAAGTLDLAGYDQTVSGLTKGASAGTVTNSVVSTTSTLTTTGTSTFAGTIVNGSGTTALTVDGGALTLSGANTYTGATTIQNGVLSVSGSLADAGAITVAGGIYDVAASDTVGAVTLSSGTISGVGTLTGSSYALTNTGTVSAALAGSGALTKTGAGTAVLSGANAYTGGTTVSGGTLRGTTASLQGSITNTAIVDFDQTTGGTYAGVLSGTGAVAKNGGGSVTFSGANDYTGGTTINGGTVIAAHPANALGSGATAINANGVLAGDGATGGAVTVNSGGTITAGTGATATDTPGTLTTGTQTWAAGGKYVAKFTDDANGQAATANGTAWDRLVMTALNVTATSTSDATKFSIRIINADASPLVLTAGQQFAIASFDTAATPDVLERFLLSVVDIVVSDGSRPYLTFGSGGGSALFLATDAQAAPEPATAALVGLGGSVLLGRRRRRLRA